ncbi:DUF1080 domain-containing protein [Bacteroidota bacterium]
MKKTTILIALLYLCIGVISQDNAPDGFTSLFNGNDFTNWTLPDGDNGHWQILDGVIDYDASSEAEGDKNLWSDKEYRDFVLLVEWRIKETPFINRGVPLILPSGLPKLDENGRPIKMALPDSDSGIYLRGSSKSQVNIWCWPIGSGEVYGYRSDGSMSDEVRAGVTPKTNADNNIGEWNKFKITMKGNKLSVELNGKLVLENAKLPGVPKSGKIALQHHGHKVDGRWAGPPSLVQFKNIYIKEL